jgi:hypothetical protein
MGPVICETQHGPVLGQPNNVKTYLVPYWIQQAMARNKLNYIDLLDYDKLRSILSIEDIASLLALNTTCLFPKRFDQADVFAQLFVSETYLYFTWSDRMSATNRVEFDNVISPLSRSDALVKSTMDRLLSDNPLNFDIISSGDLYQLQVNNDGSVFAFIQKGLLSALEDRNCALKLVSDYLQALYGLLTIPEVSARSAFKLYYKLI